ncbi:unnamed protein product [Arabidopsis lyrata]|nr:unnamed protein product [Arabidopsis lyrata]
MSIEGYDTSLHALRKHFSSCGKIKHIYVPRDFESGTLKRVAFMRIEGEGAEDKALELSGTDVGGWTAIVKAAPCDAFITPETEPKLIQIGCTIRITPEKDIRSLCEPYQLNNKDSRQETTWKIFSDHLHNPSKKNQPKRSSYEGVIQFTNRMIPSLPDLDIYGFIGAFQPDQKDLSYVVNVPTFLTHQRSSSNWNQVKTNFCLEDINFLNQNILGLPYLEADGFSHLQTKLWRPGEFLIQLGASNITSSFILSHWIKWIPSWPFIHQDFPYLDSIAFHALQQLNTLTKKDHDFWETLHEPEALRTWICEEDIKIQALSNSGAFTPSIQAPTAHFLCWRHLL